jgi:hypothetical protein
MKIEIRKETKLGKVSYWTYVDGMFDHWHSSLEDAEKRFTELVELIKVPPTVEVLKSFEI